ncbi:MAG: NAD(P)-dependent oxidoreductase, partial [Desulfurococcaceae archaeon]
EYVEAPVYGSADEARDCKLISMVACSENILEAINNVLELYSSRIFYTGKPPTAAVLKLALNNIGLSIPAIIAESLMLLESWGVDIDLFRKVANSIWFGQVIDRYWARITEEKPPRFKVWMAGKDYSYLASALKEKRLPSMLSDAFASMYMFASTGGYGDKDYPQIARYYMELAKKAKSSTNS